MEITVLNTLFAPTYTIDTPESFIWTERYNDTGEFEFYGKFSNSLLSMFPKGYYLKIANSDRIMVIETIKIKSDPEAGDKLVVTGRSLESILDRRIILRQLLIDSSLQSGIQTILNTQIINGTFTERNFPSFLFSASTDPLVTTPTLKAQYYADVVFDVIKALTQQYNLGFRILLNTSNQMVFSLYAGSDRSYSQSTNSYVVFSPNFDNLISSEYLETDQFYKNFVLVSSNFNADLGDPEVAQVWTADVGTGLNRLEMFSDARQLQKVDLGTGLPISDTNFQSQLFQRGLEELSRNAKFKVFDAYVNLNNSYKYNTDFFLGDIVQTEDNYGHAARVRIVGMTFSESVQGSTMYPTLQAV